MSGHSKWSSIKHKKAANDSKRAKAFTKIAKELVVAARLGGADVESNPRLRTALAKAKAANMAKDNIEKAIKKGTGDLDGVNYEECTYEGYGHSGTAIYIESLTDNRNRTTADLRHLFSKYGGNLGESGSVAWMFERKGLILIPKKVMEEDELFEIIIEAGAEDLDSSDAENYEVITSFVEFDNVKKYLESKKIEIESSSIEMIPKNKVEVDVEVAKKVLNLMDKLEDNDDVQNVYANIEIPEELFNE